jgi:hypothetical protein
MKKLRQLKRKPRGKAKPIPIEAKRLAWLHHRVQRGETHIYVGSKRRLVPAEKWVVEQFKRCDGEMLYHVSRALKRSETEAERVIRDNWSRWNGQGLKWGERALEMSKHGFNQFKNMSLNGFKTMCTRQLGLQYRPVK